MRDLRHPAAEKLRSEDLYVYFKKLAAGHAAIYIAAWLNRFIVTVQPFGCTVTESALF